jgi:S-adenosylmethionine/arginine decarboxylase-like enzyme
MTLRAIGVPFYRSMYFRNGRVPVPKDYWPRFGSSIKGLNSPNEEHTVKTLFATGQAVELASSKIVARPEMECYDVNDIETAWGLACSFDIYECDPSTIRDADKIRKFVYELCDLIAMKRFGDCQVVNFGEDERVAGYSMVQLIETSLISAHFANASNATYLDVFSCKPYDPDVVEKFATEYFGGSSCVTQVGLRK